MDGAPLLLKELGFSETEPLFSDIPSGVRKQKLNIPRGVSEFDLLRKAEKYASLNRNYRLNFLGNGIYDRIIPSSVDSITGRAEFLTSYTPYQAEMSQGMLQSLFEFQSIINDLTAMDVTNSSMYDGTTALGEAVRMAYRVNEKKEILVPETIYSFKRRVMESYLTGLNVILKPYRLTRDTGEIDLDDLGKKICQETSAIVVDQPNSLGNIDRNASAVAEIKKDALLITYTDPILLGIIRPPGEIGSDINVMEGQQLGLHPNFGGPILGILSFRSEYVRKSPGRLIGESNDSKGKRAYVMTLQTREQHIRRSKAMSNICTNQALFAVSATAYLSIIGSRGLRSIALKTLENSQKMIKELVKNRKFTRVLSGTPFSDVLLNYSGKEDVQEKLAENGIAGGVTLKRLVDTPPEHLSRSLFFSTTEKTDVAGIEELGKILGGFT